MRQGCFRLGLYRQGMTHDLSKYSPTEFLSGSKYYSENHNPTAAERRATGIAKGWLHHKGRNKHHTEHWIDYRFEADGSPGFGCNEMPKRYLAEMFCDYVAASKVYTGEKHSDSIPLERFRREMKYKMIHPQTAKDFEKMLTVLSEQGEDAAFEYVRKWLKEGGW